MTFWMSICVTSSSEEETGSNILNVTSHVSKMMHETVKIKRMGKIWGQHYFPEILARGNYDTRSLSKQCESRTEWKESLSFFICDLDPFIMANETRFSCNINGLFKREFCDYCFICVCRKYIAFPALERTDLFEETFFLVETLSELVQVFESSILYFIWCLWLSLFAVRVSKSHSSSAFINSSI